MPLENLQVFKDVSVVARDFNLHLHMNRLKSVNHKAELHNNSGINKEELKYIIEFPKDQSLDKGKQFVDSELGKLMPGSKWEGVQSATDHIPSEGEW